MQKLLFKHKVIIIYSKSKHENCSSCQNARARKTNPNHQILYFFMFFILHLKIFFCLVEAHSLSTVVALARMKLTTQTKVQLQTNKTSKNLFDIRFSFILLVKNFILLAFFQLLVSFLHAAFVFDKFYIKKMAEFKI